ncbi:MAG: type II toxin-antitoxin system RelE/ParE family toxin, partial [Bacteroidales bacterium]
YLNAAKDLNDLKIPPGNRLELLKGEYKGKYSIRINDQYRIIFRFENSNAYNVEIIDYH